MSDWLSRVQLSMLVLLSDGRPHSRKELHALLADTLSPPSNVYHHISRIRKFLPAGHAIVCEIHERSVHYRHVRLLNSPQKKARRRGKRAG